MRLKVAQNPRQNVFRIRLFIRDARKQSAVRQMFRNHLGHLGREVRVIVALAVIGAPNFLVHALHFIRR